MSEIALIEGADPLTTLGCLKRQMGIGEIDVPVAGQLDSPNDELTIVDFGHEGRY